MKITNRSSSIPVEVIIALEEDSFDRTYDAPNNSREHGMKMRVNRLRAEVNLATGRAAVTAYGHLYDKAGESPTARSRQMDLHGDEIPREARAQIARRAFEVLSQISEVKQVRF